MAWLKAGRWLGPGRGFLSKRNCTEADLKAMLADGGKAHDMILPGSIAWERVKRAIAIRDGDEKQIAEFEAERQEAAHQLSIAVSAFREW